MMEFDWVEISLRIALAALAGMALGANRWLHHKSAGVKTHGLVAIGAAVAVMAVMPMDLVGEEGVSTSADAVSRVLQGLLTGIGFLGAGVIVHKSNEKRVQGLTTAASIWITTLIGAAFGMGHLNLGIVTVVAAGIVLLVGNTLERLVGERFAAEEDTSPKDGPLGV